MTSTSTARTLGDWLHDPDILRPPAITVPHLAVEGRVTLLSGREKIGKSELLGYAVAAASRGADVLGVTLPAPLCTLWYAIDEPVADAVRRFERLGADPHRVIVNDVPRRFDHLHAAITADLEVFPGIGLVVVDTLSRLMAVSGVDPNSSSDVEPVIAQMVDFFHQRNLAAVLSYHTGKGGREYRGSTALGATVDEILTLRRRGHVEDADDFDDEGVDDGRRLLVQDGRTLRGRVHLTRVNGRYQLFDDAFPPREKILGALRDHGAVGSRNELCKLAGVRKIAGLHAITELVGEGLVIETGTSLKLALPVVPVRELQLPLGTSGTSGSQRFPEGGTSAEPATGTGSRNGNPLLTETGTGATPRGIA